MSNETPGEVKTTTKQNKYTLIDVDEKNNEKEAQEQERGGSVILEENRRSLL